MKSRIQIHIKVKRGIRVRIIVIKIPKCSRQCCGSEMFIPDLRFEFFHPGPRVKKPPKARSATRNGKRGKYFNPKIVIKLSKYDPEPNVMLDPGFGFFPSEPRIRIQGSKKRYFPAPKHWLKSCSPGYIIRPFRIMSTGDWEERCLMMDISTRSFTFTLLPNLGIACSDR